MRRTNVLILWEKMIIVSAPVWVTRYHIPRITLYYPSILNPSLALNTSHLQVRQLTVTVQIELLAIPSERLHKIL